MYKYHYIEMQSDYAYWSGETRLLVENLNFSIGNGIRSIKDNDAVFTCRLTGFDYQFDVLVF